MKTARERIANRIAEHDGVTSIGLLAGDLDLAVDTVKRHVRALIRAGRFQYGWDGCALEMTDAERHERRVDARVRARR